MILFEYPCHKCVPLFQLEKEQATAKDAEEKEKEDLQVHRPSSVTDELVPEELGLP